MSPMIEIMIKTWWIYNENLLFLCRGLGLLENTLRVLFREIRTLALRAGVGGGDMEVLVPCPFCLPVKVCNVIDSSWT